MQKQMFKDEIKFLEVPKSMKTLDLVNNLNIFKDNEDLLRVGGRVSKSKYCFIFKLIKFNLNH